MKKANAAGPQRHPIINPRLATTLTSSAAITSADNSKVTAAPPAYRANPCTVDTYFPNNEKTPIATAKTT